MFSFIAKEQAETEKQTTFEAGSFAFEASHLSKEFSSFFLLFLKLH